MVHNPGGDWHPGQGDNPILYIYIYQYTMKTHVSCILRGYDPYFLGLKPFMFHGLGVQRYINY